MMTVSKFRHEQEGVSRSLGRSASLRVRFEGENAMTDGESVIYPSLPEQTRLTNAQANVFRGYADHEIAHIEHSDFDAFKDVSMQSRKDGEKLLPQLVNAIEDMRIERLACANYPGAAAHLTATIRALGEKKNDKLDALCAKGDWRIIPVAVTWAGRSRRGMKVERFDGLLDTLPHKTRTMIDGTVAAIDNCDSTFDAIVLARKLRAMIDVSEEPPQEQDGGEGEGEGEGDSQPGDSQPGDDDSQSSSSDDDAKSGDENQVASDDPVRSDLAEAVDDIVRKLTPPVSGTLPYRPFTTDHDRVVTSQDIAKYEKRLRKRHRENYKDYDAQYHDIRDVVLASRRKMERILAATRDRSWRGGYESGRLDSKRLTAAYQGSSNVWRQRVDTSDFNTAVTLLVDHSASMQAHVMVGRGERKSRIAIAAQTSMVLSSLLERLDVPVEVLGFNENSGYSSDLLKQTIHRCQSTASPNYSWRVSALKYYVYKGFRQPLRVVKKAIEVMTYSAAGNNSDGESIAWAWSRLREREEQRKILIVLSDGDPTSTIAVAHGGGRPHDHHGWWYTKAMIREVREEGCEVMGIGVATNSVQHFYNEYVVVNDVKELPTTVLQEIGRKLARQGG